VIPGDDELDEPAPVPVSRSLAELAAEGRERQAAALAAEADEARRMDLRERREVERLGRANVRASLLDSPRGAAPPLLPLASGAVVLGTLLLLLPGERWAPVGLGLIALAIGGFFGGRWIVGMRLVRVERRWLLALPFPVRGYFRVLGATPAEERAVRVRIHFRDAAPEREMLDGLLGRVRFPASARLTGGSGSRWTAESGPIRTIFVDDGHPSNATTLEWMRGVIEEALLPLHQTYPIRRVEFRE
jgi:hypothetical protein